TPAAAGGSWWSKAPSCSGAAGAPGKKARPFVLAAKRYDLLARMMQTTRAKRVTPSMSAAAMIMEVRMSPPADGCREVPSIAADASLPMPIPAPRTARPAPKPAARNAIATLPIVSSCLLSTAGIRLIPIGCYLRPATSRRRVLSDLVRRAVVVAVLALGLVTVAVVVVVGDGDAHPDEQPGEHGEDVRLQERHEELEEVDADGERHRDRRERHALHDEDEAQQEEDDD